MSLLLLALTACSEDGYVVGALPPPPPDREPHRVVDSLERPSSTTSLESTPIPHGDGEAAVPCEHGLELGSLVLNREGWRLESVASGLDSPTALDESDDGVVYVGAGLGTWDGRSVVAIDSDGAVSGSDAVPDLDGVGLDADGVLYAAGSDDLWQVGSLFGGSDTVVATASGTNINDLVVDRAGDGALYVGLNDGRALRLEDDGSWTTLVDSGDEISIAVDPDGDLWAIRRNQGTVIEVDTATGAERSRVELVETRPGLLRVNRIAFDSDGVMALSAYVEEDGAQIALWDPADPLEMPDLVEGMEDDERHPDDVHWSPDGACLLISLPLVGEVIRACDCDAG